jgi:hypothetical protein
MNIQRVMVATVCGVALLAAGCHKTNHVDKASFKSAINDYYGARQECVWSSPMKFPAQADTSNEDQTKGFDALTDAGLLTRNSQEKKRFLIGSKQVNVYDISEKGRSVWTADQSQPGYGNFCYGHASVTTIDSYTPKDNPDADNYSVTYHYKVTSLPGWAQSGEMQTAFPKIAADASGNEMATANLTKSTNGWQVGSVQPTGGGASLPQ